MISGITFSYSLSKHRSGSLLERRYGQFLAGDNLFLVTVTPTIGTDTFSWHRGHYEEVCW